MRGARRGCCAPWLSTRSLSCNGSLARQACGAAFCGCVGSAGPPPAILGSSACKGAASRAPGASPEASARSPPG